MARPRNVKGSSAASTVRRDLEARYADRFGCPPTDAPWGTRWTEVFDELENADKAYREAEAALMNLYGALSQGRKLLEKRGLPLTGPFDEAAGVGLTVPEYQLLYFFHANDRAAIEALDWLSWMLDLMTLPALEKQRKDPKTHAGVMAGAEAALSGRGVLAFAEARERLDQAYRAGCARLIRRWERDPANGALLEPPELLATWPGPPPRAPGSLEWRRGILLELMDMYPLRNEKTWEMPSDRDLALASLVTGAFDELCKQSTGVMSISKGADHVLHRERKAIAEARKRRGFSVALKKAAQEVASDGKTRTLDAMKLVLKKVQTSGISRSSKEDDEKAGHHNR